MQLRASCILLGVLLGAEISAQAPTAAVPRQITLSGIVNDTGGIRINGAEIRVGLDRTAISDDSGSFSVTGIPGDTINFVVRRIGYVPKEASLIAQPGIAGISVAVTLVPSAVTLGTVVIEGKTLDRDLWAKGFYARERGGRGVFFTPERMAKTGASLGTMMNEVPSLRVIRRRGSAIPMARVGGGVTGPRYCPMNIYLDGVYLPWATEVGIDNVIDQREVKAIEVYNRPSMVPHKVYGIAGTQAGGTFSINGECGAILLWSKPIETKTSSR